MGLEYHEIVTGLLEECPPTDPFVDAGRLFSYSAHTVPISTNIKGARSFHFFKGNNKQKFPTKFNIKEIDVLMFYSTLKR